jgi:hypothetical protein
MPDVLDKLRRLFAKLNRLRLVDAHFEEVRGQIRELGTVDEAISGAVLALQQELAQVHAREEQTRAELEELRKRIVQDRAELEQARELAVRGLQAELAQERVLRQTEQEAARLQARTDLQATQADAHSHAQTQAQSQAVLRGVVWELRELFDLFKSRIELGPALFDEFQRFKASSPLPDRPLVSVCVATYNRADLLTQRCIPSILAQTYPHFELLVVGDGCTDDTAARVAAIADPRLKFWNLPQHGPYPSDPWRRWRVAGTPPGNEAIAAAQGDFITHLDDDDEHLPQRLEKLVAFAVERDCDLIWHPFWSEGLDGTWQEHSCAELVMGQAGTSTVFYRGWFKRLRWDGEAHLVGEPGDWNLIRKIKYLGACCARFPEPLLRHFSKRDRSDDRVAA